MSRLNKARQATRRQLKARVAFDGPSGSGKTWTSLEWATVLAGEGRHRGRILVIDTEHGSASLYSDVFTFEVITWAPPYDPGELADTIREAGAAGFAVVVVDSLSHFWEGEGGTLDIVDAAAQKARGNTFAGWKAGTPALRHLVDTILACPMHVLATMRAKTEYVLEQDNKGRQTPRKVGMAPVMRAGIEYEFTLVGDLDLDHRVSITKSRCSALADVLVQPGRAGDAARQFLEWLGSGDEAEPEPMPAPVVDVAAQKRAVLEVCGGDRGLAIEAWDRFGADVEAIEAWLHEPREDSRPDDGSVAGRLQQPAGDPERTGGGDNGDAAPGVDGTPSPAASKPLTNEQKAMHAKAGELVKAGVWPKPDADMLRKGVISAITAGRTDSSHDLDRDAMSDVLDALDAIAAGDLEVHRRATGEWSIDPVRRRREVAS